MQCAWFVKLQLRKWNTITAAECSGLAMASDTEIINLAFASIYILQKNFSSFICIANGMIEQVGIVNLPLETHGAGFVPKNLYS